MKTIKTIVIIWIVLNTIPMSAQHIEYGNIFRSGIQYVSATYTKSLSFRTDSLRRIRSWSATVTGKYSFLDNEGLSVLNNPDEIINGGVMLTHVRTLAPRWNMVATVGVGINAVSDYVRLNSLSLTGGVIFMYKVNDGLNVGLGPVITTAYGEPVVIPVPFVTWKSGGRYLLEMNMQGRPEVKISTQVSKSAKLVFMPFDADVFSAMMNVEGDNKVYTNSLFKATFGGSFRLSERWSMDANAGFVYYHKAKLQDRSVKSFWKNLFSSDDSYKYKPSLALSVGISYQL